LQGVQIYKESKNQMYEGKSKSFKLKVITLVWLGQLDTNPLKNEPVQLSFKNSCLKKQGLIIIKNYNKIQFQTCSFLRR